MSSFQLITTIDEEKYGELLPEIDQEIKWNLPWLPRIGETISFEDFSIFPENEDFEDLKPFNFRVVNISHHYIHGKWETWIIAETELG